MGGSCLAERFGHYLTLTAGEHDALARLEDQVREFRRGTVIIREGERSKDLYVVQNGWLQSSVLMGNGGRQIMRINLVGDILGLSALAFDDATETVTALTDVVLCPFDRARLASLFEDHPRLGALLFSLTLSDRSSLADRLASIGRTPARARVASLLCEVFARLRIVHGEQMDAVHMPLTQEEIGDATGLTAVHVNRMIRGLIDDGIVEKSGNLMRLLDRDRLASEANYTDRSGIRTHWLPRPR